MTRPRKTPKRLRIVRDVETALNLSARQTPGGLVARNGDPVLTWRDVKAGDVRGLRLDQWRQMGPHEPPAWVVLELQDLARTSPVSPFEPGQVVRCWVEAKGATIYGEIVRIRVQDRERLEYHVQGGQRDVGYVVEHVEAVVDPDELKEAKKSLRLREQTR